MVNFIFIILEMLSYISRKVVLVQNFEETHFLFVIMCINYSFTIRSGICIKFQQIKSSHNQALLNNMSHYGS